MNLELHSGFIFTLLVFFIILTQFSLFSNINNIGLVFIDYVGTQETRTNMDIIYSNPVKAWIKIGIHDASHAFYLKFMGDLFSQDYNKYLVFGIFLKSLTAISLYFLIFTLFRNKLFSFLTSLLFSISYSSAGALEPYIFGNEYIGLIFMNSFLILYFYSIKKTNISSLLLITSSFILSYLVAPIRTFPIFIILVLVEFYISFKNNFSKIHLSIVRLLLVLIPIIAITFASPRDAVILPNLLHFIKLISDGNWYLLLNPLMGLGYIFLPYNNLIILGQFDLVNLFSFLFSFFTSILFFLFFITVVVVSIAITKKFIRFMFKLFLIDLILNTAIFILYTHHFSIPTNLFLKYDPVVFYYGLYACILAAFVISISLTCLIEWYITGRKNIYLLLITASPLFSLVFIMAPWLTLNFEKHMYDGGIDRYFVIPAIGSSIFISSLMTVAYQRANRFRFSIAFLIILFIFINVNISKNEIARFFNEIKISGQDLQMQEFMQSQLLSYIPQDKLKNNLMFYVKHTRNETPKTPYERAFDKINLPIWVHIKRSFSENRSLFGCVAVVWDTSELKVMATTKNSSRGFLYKEGDDDKAASCFKGGESFSSDNIFYSLDNFYALNIDDNKVTNNTKNVVNDLSFK